MNKNLCKICNSDRKKIFSKEILGKYQIDYYKCNNCGFIQTEKPYWLDESYSNAITSLDIGLVSRNISLSVLVEDILCRNFEIRSKYLDFAGGYGLFTRIMRDKGFDFYHSDKYCQNIFAEHFTIDDLSGENKRFELVTSFELMEHIENPYVELDGIFSMTDNLLLSTELIPDSNVEKWWYLAVEHGQHISFYTKKSLDILAARYNKVCHSFGNLHLITSKQEVVFSGNLSKSQKLLNILKNKVTPVEKLVSKTQRDFEYVKNIISKNKKKIVFIDHSYHAKTKSSDFLVKYLKNFYEVEIVMDDGWKGGNNSDLSFIDNSYHGVIFWQVLPDLLSLRKIKNDNLIYFPMYDSVPFEKEYWKMRCNLKIVNFSKKLHDLHFKWGLNSIYVKYFPDKQEFSPGKKDEVFFWQRLSRIDFNLISKLFNNKGFKFHLHKAIDPEQTFQQPNNDQEKEFQITYSDWFETREEMWDLIKQKGIYVAPREFEGIGMSFLEAMAMGKAVVAVDNPTMNEYIKHGENGYLFDLENPQKIDFSNIENVQKNSYEYMQKGLKKWNNDKNRIIDFIESDNGNIKIKENNFRYYSFRLFSKMYRDVINGRMRQPARKVYYALRGKKYY